MDEYVKMSVALEDSNELVVLNVPSADVVRVQNDYAYLMKLIEAEKERKRLQTEQKGRQERMLDSNGDFNQCSQGSISAPPEEDETSLFVWNDQCVRLLLSLYKKHEADFTSGAQRHHEIWKTIASTFEQRGFKVSWGQCQSKLNGLKKTYKKITDYNNTTGNDRNTWPYLTIMNDIFGKNSYARLPQTRTLFASEARPSSPPFNYSACEEPKSPKRRKIGTIAEEYSANMETYISSMKEMEIIKEERHKMKIEKIDEMMAQKERQHEEKMKVMNTILEAISKNK